MKKFWAFVLMLALLLPMVACADVTYDAYVTENGLRANTITIELEDNAVGNIYYQYVVEVVNSRGAKQELTVHRATFEGKTITLLVDEFAANSQILVKCIDTYVPQEGSTGGSSGSRGGQSSAQATEAPEPVEEKVVFAFDAAQASVGAIALVDQFGWATRTFTYTKVTDDKTEALSQEYIYRLYTPKEAAEGPVPLVITIHGSGECGTDGLAMLTSNRLSISFADPSWQEKNPCYVLAVQCPNADFSNIEPQRSDFVHELYQLIHDMKAELKPSKTYLATLSMGSRLAFHLLDLHPDVELDAMLMACGRANEADVSDVTRPAIYLVHDSIDMVNKPEYDLDAYNAMVAAGHQNIRFTLTYMGFNHSIWNYVYDNENTEFMDWLFAQ